MPNLDVVNQARNLWESFVGGQPVFPVWSQVWAIALIHATWQVSMIGIVFAVIRAMVPPQNSTGRYVWGMVCLLACLLLPIGTFAWCFDLTASEEKSLAFSPIGQEKLAPENHEVEQEDARFGDRENQLRNITALGSDTSNAPVYAISKSRDTSFSNSPETENETDIRYEIDPLIDHEPRSDPLAAKVDDGEADAETSSLTLMGSFLDPTRPSKVTHVNAVHSNVTGRWRLGGENAWLLRSDTTLSVVFGGWLLGLGLVSFRLAWGSLGVLWLRTQCRALEGPWEAAIDHVRRRVHVSHRIVVQVSDEVRSAIVIGLIRPMVIVPAAWFCQLTPEMMSAVVAHEFAHVRRYDLWANLAQQITETLLFFHPVIWWLSAEIRHEREKCCDRCASAALANPLEYARTLEFLAATQLTPHAYLAHPLSFGEKPMRILERVQHVLGCDVSRHRSPGWPLGILVIVTFGLAANAGQWSNAIAAKEVTESTVKVADSPNDIGTESDSAELDLGKTEFNTDVETEFEAEVQDERVVEVRLEREGDQRGEEVEDDDDEEEDDDDDDEEDNEDEDIDEDDDDEANERDRKDQRNLLRQVMRQLQHLERQLDRQSRRLDALEKMLAKRNLPGVGASLTVQSVPGSERIHITESGKVETVKGQKIVEPTKVIEPMQTSKKAMTVRNKKEAILRQIKRLEDQRVVHMKRMLEQLKHREDAERVKLDLQSRGAEVELKLADLQHRRALLQFEQQQRELEIEMNAIRDRIEKYEATHEPGIESDEEKRKLQFNLAEIESQLSKVNRERAFQEEEQQLKIESKKMDREFHERELALQFEEARRQAEAEATAEFNKQLQVLEEQLNVFQANEVLNE